MEVTDRPAPPARMNVEIDNIPRELRNENRWVVWKWTWNGKKFDKPPLQINGRKAKSDDPSTWTSFQGAVVSAIVQKKFDGIGYTLRDSNHVGVDLDDCRDAVTGEIYEPAATIIKRMDTYTEVSPSGTGVKMIVVAKLPDRAKKVNHEVGVEI